jgi:hypothetical protein
VIFSSLSGFFSSGTWSAIRNVAIFVAFVFWISFGYWTYKDARRRIEDPLLVGLAALVGLFPPYVGPFIYMLVRPPESLEDVRGRELELRAIEQGLGGGQEHCPVCRAAVDPGYLVCPVCTTKLKQACSNCSAPLEPLWQVCPYCETPIDPPAHEGPPVLGTLRRPRPPA